MPAEQPPSIVCETCGGAHPTYLHVAFEIDERNKQELEKQKLEAERKREAIEKAMEKVDDLYAAEDLKYRNDPILPTLETGVPTALTGFLYEPFGRVDEKTKEAVKKMKTAREDERMNNSATEKTSWKSSGFRQIANVFYPEGLLKCLKDRVLHTKTIEPWSEKHALAGDIAQGELGSWGTDLYVTNTLGAIFERLRDDQKEQVARSVGLSSTEIQKILYGEYPILNLDKPRNEREKQVGMILESLFSNAEIYELLRRAWLQRFFNAGNSNKETSGGLQPGGYYLRLGLVLSPSVEVAVAPHGDYPTQATILSSRAKPKDIIGIFVNADHRSGYNLFEDEAIMRSNFGLETPLQQLGNSIFHTPQHPMEYLLAHYARPFILFLEESGFEIDTIKAYFTEYKGTYQDARTKQAKETTEKIRGALSQEEFSKIEMLAKKFFEEKSPVKNGETLWTGLVRLAEQHQLPIYNTRGELLWPKHMTHEQVVAFVAKKAEEKK